MSFKAHKLRLTLPIHTFATNDSSFYKDILQAALLLGRTPNLTEVWLEQQNCGQITVCDISVLPGKQRKDPASFNACFNDHLCFAKIKNLCLFIGMLNLLKTMICCEPRTEALEHTEEATQVLPFTFSKLLQIYKQLRHYYLKFFC